METYTVVLPNGVKIKDVPVGTSQDVLKDRAIAGGFATLEDFNQKPPSENAMNIATTSGLPTNPRQRGSTVGTTGEASSFDMQQYLTENMGLPLGVAGGIAGAVAGAPLGPVGAFVGSALGSAVGTGSGSLISDELTGKDLDYAKAVEDAVLSLGFDVATLTMGKYLKPAYISAKKKLGFSPRETAQQLVKELSPDVGSRESLRASQEILEDYGATLTPSQVGATGLELLKEQISRAGIASGQVFEENAKKINQAASDALSEVVNKLAVNSSGSSFEIAEQTMNVIEAGKNALNTNYGNSLDELVKTTGKISNIPMGKHIFAVESFVKENTKGGVLGLDPATLGFIESNLKSLLGNNMARATNLEGIIEIDKQITSQIRTQFGTPGTQTFNPTAERELSILADKLKDATQRAIQKVDPKAAKKYANLKAAFSEGRQGILPKINDRFISNASKGDYKSLGNLISGAGNINQVNAFKQSLRESFKQMEKAGTNPSDFIGFPEAEALIKKGFLEKNFPDIGKASFDINDYAREARKLNDPTIAAKYKSILGSDFPRVKQIINLMAEASTSPKSNVGELMLRSKEYSALSGLVQIGQLGAAAVGGVASAPFILLAPMYLSKVATNPKHVNRLLAFNKTKFKNEDAMEMALNAITADVIDSMTDEEQAQLRNYIREINQQ
jgi:hypothetical protein